ncbi:MAG: OmpA family protein [Bacteroidota bacterium]
MKYLLFLSLWLVWFPLGYAQDAPERSYDHHSYQEAIRKYRSILKKNPEDGEALFNLANSYRLNGDYVNAQIWYAQAVEHSTKNTVGLHYAQVLFSNGAYGLAEEWFGRYAAVAKNPVDIKNANLLAQRARELAEHGYEDQAYLIRKLACNSDKLDFSPTKLNGGEFVFASNRKPNKGSKSERDPWTGDHFVDLWVVGFDRHGNTGQPYLFSRALNDRYHEGPAAVSQQGNVLYITRNDYRKRKRGFDSKQNTQLKIYACELRDDGWMVKDELPFNDSEYSTCHPALSSDERTLVFASDRPGGYGGMDLYVVRYKNNAWSVPRNLGPAINTGGNEVFPTLHENGRLYYSSDLQVGYGGLDIFVAEPESERWGAGRNLGAPVNGARDDFGITFISGEERGFFTSNREGDDDIYWFRDLRGLRARVRVVDCETRTAIPEASVYLTTPQTELFAADRNGMVEFAVEPGQEYQLQVTGDGLYLTDDCDGQVTLSIPENEIGEIPVAEIAVSRENDCCHAFVEERIGLLAGPGANTEWDFGDGTQAQGDSVEHCYRANGTYRVSLQTRDSITGSLSKAESNAIEVVNCRPAPPKPLAVFGQITAGETGKPLPGATVRLRNACTGDTTVVRTGPDGRYALLLPRDPDCDFWLIGEHPDHPRRNIPLPIKGQLFPQGLLADVPLGGSGVPLVADVSDPGFDPTQLPESNLPEDLDPRTFPSPFGLAPAPASEESVILEEGTVIELYHIYFDYDEYYIRGDAVSDLYFLLQLLRKYPDLKGELGAHTDSRATYDYNLKLSDNRARSAKEWLIRRGISPDRIRTRGYGETQLRNRCADDVPCTESEHQRNRRVEFTVTHFDGKVELQSQEYATFLRQDRP